MHRLFFIPAAVTAAAAAFLFWAWMGRPVAVADAPEGHIHCLSYTPYDGGKAPIDPGYDVPPARIEADLKALSAVTDCIRTYSARGPQGAVVRIADALGYKVYLGIWVNAVAKDSAAEIEAAVALAKAHPNAVKGLVVGNEVMLRREMTPERLAAYIRQVKELSGGMPVTYADIYEFWRRNPILADAVDFMMVHVLPYWDDPEPVTIDAVQAHIRGIVRMVRDTFPTKPMMIGEIGWPSAGRSRGGAVPSVVNEARFLREFMGQAAGIGMDYNVIEAVDQGWKRRPEGTVGGYWGVIDSNRDLKFPLQGPVREWPRWLECFAGTVAIGLAFLAWGLLPGKQLSRRGWIGLGLVGSALGASLVLHGYQTITSSVDILGWSKGALFALLNVAAARQLLLPALGGSGLAVSGAPAGLQEVLAWLRRPTRRSYGPEIGLGLLAWTTLIAAAVMALVLAVDGRHRDLPIAGLWLPAAAFLFHRLATARDADWSRDRREEGWLALLTLLAAPFAWDGSQGYEPMAWIVVGLALALPWLGACKRVLGAPFVEPGRAGQR